MRMFWHHIRGHWSKIICVGGTDYVFCDCRKIWRFKQS